MIGAAGRPDEILIADDEEAICFGLRRAVERRGMRAHVVADGAAAVELVERNPDVAAAFLDVLMPRMNGVAAFDAIRKLVPELPCCLMTAHRGDAAVAASVDRTGVTVLEKPFSVADFLAAVDTLLSLRATARPPGPMVPVASPTVRVTVAVPSDVLRGVVRFARDTEAWTLIVERPEDLGRLLVGRPDGVIAAVRPADVTPLAARGGPVVDVAGAVRGGPFPWVGANPTAVGERAAEHLLAAGGQAFVFAGTAGSVWADRAGDGFAGRVGAAGGGCHAVPGELLSGPVIAPGTVGWLGSLPRPVGVFAAEDVVAHRIGEACRAAGLRIPADVLILGTGDDEPFCTAAHTPLSSVRLPGPAIGYAAAAALARVMAGEKPEPVRFAPLGVTVRGSTDGAATADRDLAAAVRFIRANLAERIGVDDIVAATTQSRSSLERRFRAVLGRGPLGELLRARVELAARLLADTTLTIDEVARSAGFRDGGHLTGLFRKRMNATPAQFRAAHRRD